MRLTLGRRLVNLLPVAQRTNAFTNGVVGTTYFSDAPADQSQEVLEIASGVVPGLALSEHGPCIVGGTVTLLIDDASFTAKFAKHSGGDVTQVRGEF